MMGLELVAYILDQAHDAERGLSKPVQLLPTPMSKEQGRGPETVTSHPAEGGSPSAGSDPSKPATPPDDQI